MAYRLKLGVNIDHVATLRQNRGTPYPSPLSAAEACARAGADGITVHLREDRRHIQDADVYALHTGSVLPLNLEMANSGEILKIALDVRPAEACLVPERRQELTTEGGLDADGQRDNLKPAVCALRNAGIEVSLFIDPDPQQVEAAAALEAPTVELHTGSFCEADEDRREAELQKLVDAAGQAAAAGLRVNAGHGIHLGVIDSIMRIPHLDTLNIGHSIVSRAVFVGMEAAVGEMREALAAYPGRQTQPD